MPTWLVHGFRWPRPLIRIHVVLQNIDEAAPEYTMGPKTSASILENFRSIYPEIMEHLPSLRFIEQYDPEDLETKSHPYAYVCDQVHEVKLGLDVDEIRGKGVSNEAWTALVDLRDKLAVGEKTGWFVVVNGDVERWAPPTEDDDDDDYLDGSQTSHVSQRSSVVRVEQEENEPVCWRAAHWTIPLLTHTRPKRNPKDSKNGLRGKGEQKGRLYL